MTQFQVRVIYAFLENIIPIGIILCLVGLFFGGIGLLVPAYAPIAWTLGVVLGVATAGATFFRAVKASRCMRCGNRQKRETCRKSCIA